MKPSEPESDGSTPLRQRGVRSAASRLALVPDVQQRRLPPPASLTEPERELWKQIVGSVRPDWFSRRRRHQLRVEPLCALCLEAGRVVPATVADHIESHRGDFAAFRFGRLRSLCADCHDRLDGSNAPRAPVNEDGTPSDPRHPWNAGS